MRKTPLILALALLSFQISSSQTPQKPDQEVVPDDVIRITTQLVQTDVVVTDKTDKPIRDLNLEDFELYDNGKKQPLKFMEFVSTNEGPRVESATSASRAISESTSTGLTPKDVKRM